MLPSSNNIMDFVFFTPVVSEAGGFVVKALTDSSLEAGFHVPLYCEADIMRCDALNSSHD